MESLTGQAFATGDGRTLVMAALLKSGGAGGVYVIRSAASEVAKVYHRSVDLALYERKVGAMLRLQPQLQGESRGHVQLAWPRQLLRDAAGRFRGFTMPQLDVASTSDLEHVLLEKQARTEGLPTGLGAKMTLAANLAAVVAALHAERHYVVDLKPVNLRFYRDTLQIALLDCDGLSIQGAGERFPAQQFTPDYLAPEYQGEAIVDEQRQDLFALAVVIFQLLNSGIHPYSGKPSGPALASDIPGRIRAGAYAYGIRANPLIAPNPGSGHRQFPQEIRYLFDRAFGPIAAPRPHAAEWRNLLQGFARRGSGKLRPCDRDAAHQHFAGMACAACERRALIARAAHDAKRRAPTRPATPQRPSLRPRPLPPIPWPSPARIAKRVRPVVPPIPVLPAAAPHAGASSALQRAAVSVAVPFAFAWLTSWWFLLLWHVAPSPPEWRNSVLVLVLLMAFAAASLLVTRAIPKAIGDPGPFGWKASLSTYMPSPLSCGIQIGVFALVLWRLPNLWTLAAAALSPEEADLPVQAGTVLAAAEIGVGWFRLALLLAAVPCAWGLVRHFNSQPARIWLLAASLSLLAWVGFATKPPLVPQLVLVRGTPIDAPVDAPTAPAATPDRQFDAPVTTADPPLQASQPLHAERAVGVSEKPRPLAPLELPVLGRSPAEAERAASQTPLDATPREVLARAVQAGALRRGGDADIDRWFRRRGMPVSARRDWATHAEVYFLVRELQVPPGLSGADAVVFIREAGAPFPAGDLGHSIVLDMSDGSCTGLTCHFVEDR